MIEKNLKSCPLCQGELGVCRLICTQCQSEYPIKQDRSIFDTLDCNQLEFLNTFLSCRGNLKLLCQSFGCSYPTAKKKLEDLLVALKLSDVPDSKEDYVVDLSNFGNLHHESVKASEIIKRKLYEENGVIHITLLDGKPCTIKAFPDGISFSSDKLNQFKFPYEYRVFDDICDLLLHSADHRARKGNAHGRGDKVGYGNCTADTVVGTIAIRYAQKPIGASALDPVFVLAAMLEWTGIAYNRRGYLQLTPAYLSLQKGGAL